MTGHPVSDIRFRIHHTMLPVADGPCKGPRAAYRPRKADRGGMPMEKRRLVFMVLAATLVCAGAASVGAQTASPSPPAPKPFSFGDLMNTLVQPRHVKLALAGQE